MLSCTGVFLAATVYPESFRSRDYQTFGEGLAFSEFFSALQRFDSQLQRLRKDYYRLGAERNALVSVDKFSDSQISAALVNAITDWRIKPSLARNDQVRFSALDLMRAVLSFDKSALPNRLQSVDLNREHLIALIPGNPEGGPASENVESAAGQAERTSAETAVPAHNRSRSLKKAAKPVEETAKRRAGTRERRRVDIPPEIEGTPDIPSEAEPAGATQRDLRSRIDRDPDDPTQFSLGIKVYAAALATILRTARGEFCLGLFGPWGIGKTRLVRHMMPLLEQPATYMDAMKERGYQVGNDSDDTLTYEVVWYSAWKFRRPPEAWIFLYETLATQAMAAGLWCKFGRVMRVGVARHGFWPLIFGLMAIGLAMIPLDSWLRLGGAVVAALGIGGLVYGLGIIRRSRESVRSLATRYATLTRHGERLGLQALIGSDLRALLLGWIPWTRDLKADPDGALKEMRSGAFSNLPWRVALALLGGFAAIWLWAMLGAPAIPEQAKSALKDLCGVVMEQNGFWCVAPGSSPSVRWPYYIIVFAGWVACCAAALQAVRFGGKGTDRILLVVDDLDRCSPSEVIEIAESLKLLLEDTGIQKRVQILMLVDEQILEFAIQNKFKDVIEDRVAKSTAKRKRSARSDVINEHIEKLFACYLRLPMLSAEEIGEVARLYAQGDLQRRNATQRKEIDAKLAGLSVPVPPQAGPVKDIVVFPLTMPPEYPVQGSVEVERAGLTATELQEQQKIYNEQKSKIDAEREELVVQRALISESVSLDDRDRGGHETAMLAGSGLRYGKEEIELFASELPKFLQTGARRPSPRAIRLFLFKYHLCHLLMQLSKDVAGYQSHENTPEAIFAVLAEACFSNTASGLADKRGSRVALRCIASQLA